VEIEYDSIEGWKNFSNAVLYLYNVRAYLLHRTDQTGLLAMQRAISEVIDVREHYIPPGLPTGYDRSPGPPTAIGAPGNSLRVPRPYITELLSGCVPNVFYGLTSHPGFSCIVFSLLTIVIWSNTSHLIYFSMSAIFVIVVSVLHPLDDHVVVARRLSMLS
jgi:hypothetical protein